MRIQLDLSTQSGKKPTCEMIYFGALLVALSIATPAFARALDLDRRATFNIPAQPLESALLTFSRQSHVQVLIAQDVAHTALAPSLRATVSVRAALDTLIADAGLKYSVAGESISLTPKNGTAVWSAPEVAAETGQTVSSESADNASPQSNPETTQGALTDRGQQRIDEVIVTAEKRPERLLDVPVPVTAISGNALAEQDQLTLREYYTKFPGLTIEPRIQGQQNLTIRGVTTGGFINPTVSITVDDVPYGSSTNNGGGLRIPDIDPSELAQVEVLRGPQGTLYGSSSMGGMLKFVTRNPTTNGFSGNLQAGARSVYNGDVGQNVRGSVNIPINDTFAVLASAFTRSDPGYVDDPVHGRRGVNSDDVYGGRASALWQPTEAVSLKFGALVEENKARGAPDVDVGLGDLQQNRLPGTGTVNEKIQAYSLSINTKLGGADLTAVTGYNINTNINNLDAGFAYAPSAKKLFGVGGATILTNNENKKFTQEARISVPIGRKIQWLFGAFYTHEDSSLFQDVSAADPATGAFVGSMLHITLPTTYQEYAGFTDFTYNFTDRFDTQIGLRESEIKQEFVSINTGLLAGKSTPAIHTSANAFTYLVTPRFKITPDLMLYARLASGYRPGGANGGGGVPLQYSPDTTRNYEVGLKGAFLDHSLTVDGSLYYIDWKDIQLGLLNPATLISYTGNGGRAKSQGVELSAESRPLNGLTIGGWVVWDEAVLTDDLPPTSTVYGKSGDRLPNTSGFSASLSVEWRFLIADSWTGVVGSSENYVGERVSVFRAVPLRQIYPAYARTDARAGVERGGWSLNLFVTNATDRRGVLYGGLGASPSTAFTYIQPRTVGMTLAKRF